MLLFSSRRNAQSETWESKSVSIHRSLPHTWPPGGDFESHWHVSGDQRYPGVWLVTLRPWGEWKFGGNWKSGVVWKLERENCSSASGKTRRSLLRECQRRVQLHWIGIWAWVVPRKLRKAPRREEIHYQRWETKTSNRTSSVPRIRPVHECQAAVNKAIWGRRFRVKCRLFPDSFVVCCPQQHRHGRPWYATPWQAERLGDRLQAKTGENSSKVPRIAWIWARRKSYDGHSKPL